MRANIEGAKQRIMMMMMMIIINNRKSVLTAHMAQRKRKGIGLSLGKTSQSWQKCYRNMNEDV